MSDNFLSYTFSRVTKEGQDQIKNNSARSKRDARIYRGMNMAIAVAKKYKAESGTNMHIEDLIQFSNMGLCYASDRFDDEKGVEFTSYAYAWCKKYVLEAINMINNQFGTTHKEAIGSMGAKFISMNGSLTGVASSKINQSDDDKKPSLQESIAFADVYSDHDEMMDVHRQKEYQFNVVNGILDKLTDKERRVTCAFFGLAPFESANDIKEVSAKMRLRKSVVETVLFSAIEKMKSYASDVELNADFILKMSAVISKYKNIAPDFGDYVDTDEIYKHALNPEFKYIAENSGLSERDMLNALYLDDQQDYNFFARREIAGLIVYQKFTVERRFKKYGGTAKISVSYSVFNKSGECLKKDVFVHNILGVTMKTFQEWLYCRNVNQMYSPHYGTNK